jgi:hypothetical protein
VHPAQHFAITAIAPETNLIGGAIRQPIRRGSVVSPPMSHRESISDPQNSLLKKATTPTSHNAMTLFLAVSPPTTRKVQDLSRKLAQFVFSVSCFMLRIAMSKMLVPWFWNQHGKNPSSDKLFRSCCWFQLEIEMNVAGKGPNKARNDRDKYASPTRFSVPGAWP